MSKTTLNARLTVLAAVLPLAMLGGCDQVSGLVGGGEADKAAVASADAAGKPASDAAPAAASVSDPLLANPMVGDLYASELTAFSAASFSAQRGDPMAKAYGLLKVVEVQPDRVFVITETGAWDNANGTRNELQGDLADITWDDAERIPILRADFARLLSEGKIISTRRLDRPAAAPAPSAPAAAPAAAPAPAAPAAGKPSK